MRVQSDGKKIFERRVITEKDLCNDVPEQTSFKSSWANKMDRRKKAAKKMVIQDWEKSRKDHDKTGEQYKTLDGNGEREWEEEREPTCCWERLQRKDRKTKMRKPIEVVNWFADEPHDSSEPSLDSQGDEESWTEIERNKVNQQMRRRRRVKKNERMQEVVSKMKHMVGAGPIPESSV